MKTELIAALLTATFICPVNAASVAKTYSYFSVGGSTLDAVQQQFDARGPVVKQTGRRHPGAVQLRFVNTITYQSSANSCGVAAASVAVKARVILPRWRGPLAPDRAVRLIWLTLSADIKRHEESHIIIAKNYARMLEQTLLTIRGKPNCETALAKAEEAAQTVLAKHYNAQAEFDRIEGMNFESRIVRLLRYRIERTARRNFSSPNIQR